MSYTLIRPLLFSLPPEVAHHFTLTMLSYAYHLKILGLVYPPLPPKTKNIMGLAFPNNVGLAAGLDKDGEYIDALAAVGFGFIEIGTVTPRPQPGNPKPRMFRIPSVQGLINRMGFNSQGVDYVIEQVSQAKFTGILGINIGKNFDTPPEEASNDYLICMKKVYPYASYITINISSPNTPGLRDLQHAHMLINLLGTLKDEQKQLQAKHNKYVPIVLKIAPDLDKADIQNIAQICIDQKIDGVISANTTLSRAGVSAQPHANEAGGLSGQLLFTKSLHNLKILRAALKDNIPIIGCGGVMCATDIEKMVAAGADLVQVYTGLIYHGPQFMREYVYSC